MATLDPDRRPVVSDPDTKQWRNSEWSKTLPQILQQCSHVRSGGNLWDWDGTRWIDGDHGYPEVQWNLPESGWRGAKNESPALMSISVHVATRGHDPGERPKKGSKPNRIWQPEIPLVHGLLAEDVFLPLAAATVQCWPEHPLHSAYLKHAKRNRDRLAKADRERPELTEFENNRWRWEKPQPQESSDEEKRLSLLSPKGSPEEWLRDKRRIRRNINRIHGWLPWAQGEREELYRHAWGPVWPALCVSGCYLAQSIDKPDNPTSTRGFHSLPPGHRSPIVRLLSAEEWDRRIAAAGPQFTARKLISVHHISRPIGEPLGWTGVVHIPPISPSLSMEPGNTMNISFLSPSNWSVVDAVSGREIESGLPAAGAYRLRDTKQWDAFQCGQTLTESRYCVRCRDLDKPVKRTSTRTRGITASLPPSRQSAQPKPEHRASSLGPVPVGIAEQKKTKLRPGRVAESRRVITDKCIYPLWGKKLGSLCGRTAHISGYCCAHWNLMSDGRIPTPIASVA
jgi:hypothetical protein